MDEDPKVVFFLNNVADSSIPLEIATALSQQGATVNVCSFFPTNQHTFDINVLSLDAKSQVEIRPYVDLYHYLHRQSPDVFHVHPNATGSLARIVGALAGVPIIITTEHSTHDRFGVLKNLVNGTTNWLNDTVIANSRATAESLKTWERWLLSVAGTELQVIHNGVDVPRICGDTRSQICESSTKPVIGTVGRLVPVKNHRRLLRAVAPILNEGHASLFIIGDGPEYDTLNKIAEDLKVDDSVKFFGHQSRDEVYELLHKIDVFAFPSLAEGFGVAVVEAMAAGVPPVVSDIPIMHEIVGNAGIYVHPNKEDEIREALSRLLHNESRRSNLGERAQHRAKSQFPLTKTVDAYLTVYREQGAKLQ